METNGVHHVSINVDDVEATTAFYTDIFGFEVLPRPELGVNGTWLAINEIQELHLIEADVPTPLGQHFSLRVAEIDDAVAELREKGLEVRGPSDLPNGARQAFVADPSGNLVEITQPA